MPWKKVPLQLSCRPLLGSERTQPGLALSKFIFPCPQARRKQVYAYNFRRASAEENLWEGRWVHFPSLVSWVGSHCTKMWALELSQMCVRIQISKHRGHFVIYSKRQQLGEIIQAQISSILISHSSLLLGAQGVTDIRCTQQLPSVLWKQHWVRNVAVHIARGSVWLEPSCQSQQVSHRHFPMSNCSLNTSRDCF